MSESPNTPRRPSAIWTAVVEVAFIIFLFYSNLLMGEFTRGNGQGKSLGNALRDIFTVKSFEIALFAASLGFLTFAYLRKRL